METLLTESMILVSSYLLDSSGTAGIFRQDGAQLELIGYHERLD
jgi:hypothetical protein